MRFGAFRFQIQEDDEGEAGVSAHLSSSNTTHPTSTVRCCFPLVIESALGNLGLALSMHGHVLEQAENCGPKKLQIPLNLVGTNVGEKKGLQFP
jgi:hypothetical protein